MRAMRRLWLLLAIAAAAGCGRTRLFNSLGPGAGAVAMGGSAAGGSGGTGAFAGTGGRITGGSGGTGGEITGGSAGTGGSGGAPACTAWSVAPAAPVALTDATGDSMLTSLRADGNHVFVGTMNDNDPSPDPTWRVRVIKDDLSDLGTSHVVMKHPQSVSLSGLGVAIGSGHRGAVAWDDAEGCRFVELGPDGAVIASPRPIAKTWCYWPIATQIGFAAFSSPAFTFTPLTLLVMDRQGTVIKRRPDVITSTTTPNQTYPRGVAHFDDGTLLVAWSDVAFYAQHLDTDGNKLGPRAGLTPGGPNARFALASTGSGALIALGLGDAGTGNLLRVEPFDENGHTTGPPVTLVQTNQAIGHVAVARAMGVALVAWSEGQSGAEKTIRVVPVSFDGKPLGAPFVAPSPPFVGNLRLVGTPAGALLVYEAEQPNTLTQVFAERLVCR